MSCPICNRTMQNLGSPERRIFWCSWCGTLKETNGDFQRVEMPGMLRHVVMACKLDRGRRDVSQCVSLDARFDVRQRDEEIATVELVVLDSAGRRVI